MNANNGDISTAATLTGDTSYALEITATDRNGAAGALSSVATVIITVTTVNSADPVFSPATYTDNPNENVAVGTQLVQVSTEFKVGPIFCI